MLVDHRRTIPVLIFFAVLIATLAVVLSIEKSERIRQRSELMRVANEAASALERRASVNASYLRAGAALFALQPKIDSALFRRYVEELRLDTDYRGAEGIGWAPVLTVQPNGTALSTVGEVETLENLRPSLAERPRPLVVAVKYLQPDTQRNARAVGFDMYAEPVRRAAMEAAEASVRPTASGKVVLAQEGNGKRPGFLIYMPVFENIASGRRLRGFIYSPYNAQDFLSAAADLFERGNTRVALYDGDPGPATSMASLEATAKGGAIASVRQPLRLANRPMVLEVEAVGSRSLSMLSMITLIFGLSLASLLMLVSRLLSQQLLEDQRALQWFAEQNSIRNSLTRELNHRVKNTLANVLSIVTLTRRRAKTLDEFADGIDGRIRALSATHDLLTQSEWSTTPIASVVAAELAPYTKTEDGVLEVSGPMVELAPNDALTLGLVLHELATNASKYGALSVPGGRVSIRWRTITEELAEVDWRERGGPQVATTRARGFGTDLIEKIVAHELKNPVDLVFAPDGVRCSLRVPVRQPVDFALRSRPSPAQK